MDHPFAQPRDHSIQREVRPNPPNQPLLNHAVILVDFCNGGILCIKPQVIPEKSLHLSKDLLKPQRSTK